MGLAAKGMILTFVVFAALNVYLVNRIYSDIRGWIEPALNCYYISVATIMLFVCFDLMCSRFGSIRLGDDDPRPEFSNFSWFYMPFSAAWGYPKNAHADHAGITEMTVGRGVAATRVTYFH